MLAVSAATAVAASPIPACAGATVHGEPAGPVAGFRRASLAAGNRQSGMGRAGSQHPPSHGDPQLMHEGWCGDKRARTWSAARLGQLVAPSAAQSGPRAPSRVRVGGSSWCGGPSPGKERRSAVNQRPRPAGPPQGDRGYPDVRTGSRSSGAGSVAEGHAAGCRPRAGGSQRFRSSRAGV